MNQGILTWLKALLVENAYYKLFSLALVVLLYAWVLGDRASESSITLPIRLVVPQGMIITKQSVKEAEVTFSGRLGAIEMFNSQGSSDPILIDVPERTGDLPIQIPLSKVSLPPGLKAKYIRPSSMRLTIEARASKRVPIRPRTLGDPKIGHVISGLSLEPSTVNISGPAAQIRRTTFMQTEPIDISGKAKTFSAQVELRPNSPLIRDDLDKPVVVTVNVEATEGERVIKKVPVLAVNTVKQTKVTPQFLELTLKGPKSVMDSIDTSSIFAAVDLEGEQRTGIFQKSAQVKNLPQGVTLVRFYPKDFQIKTLASSSPTPAPPKPQDPTPAP